MIIVTVRSTENCIFVHISAKVDSKPPSTVKWFKDGAEISDRSDFQVTFSNGVAMLAIPEVFEEDAGKFVCSATNDKGTVNSSAELIVKGKSVSYLCKCNCMHLSHWRGTCNRPSLFIFEIHSDSEIWMKPWSFKIDIPNFS